MLLDRERDRRSAPRPAAARIPVGPGDRAVVCAACGHHITDEDQRIAMHGAHEHLFVNPAGLQYQIGCYRAAPGCAHHGAPDGTFSWFPGWSWQLVGCAACRAHLGWAYRNASERFYGLIVDRIRLRDGT